MNSGSEHPLGKIALTFDTEHSGGPRYVADGAVQILDILAQFKVEGTFFLEGRWAEANPEVARRMPAAGHLVGNHSYWHADLRLLTAAGLSADLHAVREGNHEYDRS